MIDNAAADFCMTFNTKGIVSDNYVFTAVELQVTSYLAPATATVHGLYNYRMEPKKRIDESWRNVSTQ